MKAITHREFRDNFATVMDAVEAGEVVRVIRNGVEVAELRPVGRRGRLTAAELVERHRKLPRVDHARMQREADEFSGTGDHIGDGARESRR
ncbi:type II toxin-antitoxin system Phd/YefM family antitoxin [Nocardia pseudovaccinii]|uniref:type II toxin-antitoxin system Phd/YefM family antitoxin n=1 Tax=Nocardia pseudovaccinii TaxID=189540 RepID=UPI0009FDC5D5|nr:type II toxin-antitoxin system prevent-host-death family antitoxin [Nocardia pseudovaccinii]